MKGLLGFLLLVALGGSGWFYQTQYEPLVQNVADQAGKIDALNAQLTSANSQLESAKSQINLLAAAKAAHDLQIADLKGQLAKSAATTPASDQILASPGTLPAKPNWTWSVLGRDYNNVVVTKVEADCVHVTYDGGTGSINLSDLPPELRNLFNYDPALAQQATQEKAAAAAKIDAQQAPLIAAEEQKEKAAAAADDAQHQNDIRNQNAANAGSVARDQIRIIQQDMQDMEAAHEVTVSTGYVGNPPTPVVHYGGTTFWLNKYYADQAAIAQLSRTANSASR